MRYEICSIVVAVSIPPSAPTPTPRATPLSPSIAHLARASATPPITAIIASTPAPASTPTSTSVSAIIAPTATPAVVAAAPVASRAPVTSHTAFPLPRPLVLLIQHVYLVAQRALAGLQHVQIFQVGSAGQLPQTGRADAVFCEEIVDELVHVGQAKVLFEPPLDLAVVRQQRLQGSVYLHRLPCQPDVEGR